MVVLPDRLLMSAEEYFAWEETQLERHEYWDGEVFAMTGGTRPHNRVSFNCSKVLDDLLAERDCEVYISDVKVQVEADRKYFYPDVVVTCDARDDLRSVEDHRDARLVQYPCLIVEVLSPSTEAVDRGIKFMHYRQAHTLQTYLLVQPDAPRVEGFTRNEAGQWVLTDYGFEDEIELPALVCRIAVKDLYERVTFESPSEPDAEPSL
jgi:Uma2 family endonuclease